jgi:hypothetical protein
MNMEHCINVCNSLLRGERSAVETYGQAIAKLSTEIPDAELYRIQSEHANAVMILEENVRSMGGEPDKESGAWGAFAQAIQGTANSLGVKAALECLQTGEKSGQRDYEMALFDEDVMPACKDMISTSLLPFTSEHIAALENLQKVA